MFQFSFHGLQARSEAFYLMLYSYLKTILKDKLVT